MICKFCNAEIGDDHKFCPYCGKGLFEEEIPQEQAEAPEQEILVEEVPVKKPGMKVWQIVLAACGAVVALTALALVLLTAFGVKIGPRPNDIHKKDSYTVSDKKVEKKADQIVAQVGDSVLTNGVLQIYYAESVYSFVEQNYYYLSSYGLDITKPLSEQECILDKELSWEQYFLDNALESWRRYAVLENMAKAAGFTMDEDMQNYLKDLPKYMEETAKENKYDTVQAWLSDNFGPNTSQEDYISYMTTYYTGSAYLVSRYDELNPTEAEADTYFKENEEAFKENGITKESGKYYDVRHILIEPEGGKENEDGTEIVYTEAEWEACRIKAQQLLDQWKSGEATEESFAELATEHSVDTGSSADGGLYSQLTKETNFVEEFKNWYLDKNRQKGDTGLVKSVYGYHIMYFSNSQEIWYATAVQQIMGDRVSKLIEGGKETFPVTYTFGKIALAEIAL